MGSENKGKKNLVSLFSGPRRGSSKPGVTGRSHVHETVCYFLAGVFVSYRFDVYRKVPKDLTEPTLTGAVSKFFFPILVLEYSAPFSLLNFLQGPQVSCNQHRWGGGLKWNCFKNYAKECHHELHFNTTLFAHLHYQCTVCIQKQMKIFRSHAVRSLFLC